jgi:hypothetical protein
VRCISFSESKFFAKFEQQDLHANLFFLIARILDFACAVGLEQLVGQQAPYMEMEMKKSLLATAAVAAVVAFGSPAFAPFGNEAMVEPPAAAAAQELARSARAQATTEGIRRRGGSPHSTNPTHDVFDSSGNYLGSDPDPHVRSTLAFDTPDIE